MLGKQLEHALEAEIGVVGTSVCPEVTEIKPRGVERAAEPTLEISNMAKKSDARVADIEIRIVDVRCVPKDRIFYLGVLRGAPANGGVVATNAV